MPSWANNFIYSLKLKTPRLYFVSAFFLLEVGWQYTMIGPWSEIKIGKFNVKASGNSVLQLSLQYHLSNLSRISLFSFLLFDQVNCTPWYGISMRLQSSFHSFNYWAPLMFLFPPSFCSLDSSWLKSPSRRCFPGCDHRNALMVFHTGARFS